MIKSNLLKPYNEKPVRLFKANPLDINLASMQEKIMQRCEREVCEYGDFAPLIEKYLIAPQYRDEVFADTIKLVCCNADNNNESKKQRILELVVNNPNNTIETHCVIKQGTKEEILEVLNDTGLFLDLKNDVLNICNGYKNLN